MSTGEPEILFVKREVIERGQKRLAVLRSQYESTTTPEDRVVARKRVEDTETSLKNERISIKYTPTTVYGLTRLGYHFESAALDTRNNYLDMQLLIDGWGTISGHMQQSDNMLFKWEIQKKEPDYFSDTIYDAIRLANTHKDFLMRFGKATKIKPDDGQLFPKMVEPVKLTELHYAYLTKRSWDAGNIVSAGVKNYCVVTVEKSGNPTMVMGGPTDKSLTKPMEYRIGIPDGGGCVVVKLPALNPTDISDFRWYRGPADFYFKETDSKLKSLDGIKTALAYIEPHGEKVTSKLREEGEEFWENIRKRS